MYKYNKLTIPEADSILVLGLGSRVGTTSRAKALVAQGALNVNELSAIDQEDAIKQLKVLLENTEIGLVYLLHYPGEAPLGFLEELSSLGSFMVETANIAKQSIYTKEYEEFLEEVQDCLLDVVMAVLPEEDIRRISLQEKIDSIQPTYKPEISFDELEALESE